MAIKEKVTFDKTEVIVYDDSGKRMQILNLTYDKITSVQLDHSTMRYMGVLKKPSDRIAITIRGLENPVVLYSAKEGEKFNEYVEGFRKFCKDNRISLHDYLAHPEEQK